MIRKITPSDMPEFITLCSEHAEYEQSHYDKRGKLEPLIKAFFGSEPELYGIILEVNKNLCGFATYMIQYSTWDAENYVYLDCLFIRETYRGIGWGAKMLQEIKEEGLGHGCQLMQWQTPIFNEKAIKFYKREGALFKTKQRFFLEL